MPYCQPHHTARDRIIDIEVMRLELRSAARRCAPRAGGHAAIIQFPRDRAAASQPYVA